MMRAILLALLLSGCATSSGDYRQLPAITGNYRQRDKYRQPKQTAFDARWHGINRRW